MKSKIVILGALGVGTYTSGSWAYLFLTFVQGHSAHEPDQLVATMELSLAVVFTLICLSALILSLRRFPK